MVKPMEKSTAFSFVDDLIAKMEKERELSDYLLDLFRDHFDKLDKNGETKLLIKRSPGDSIAPTTKRSQLQIILLTIMRMKLYKTQQLVSDALSINITDKNSESLVDDLLEKASDIGNSILGSVIKFKDSLWQNGIC